jgi:hypothetical protein
MSELKYDLVRLLDGGWAATAQRIYDEAEKSGADYIRRSTTRAELVRLLESAGERDAGKKADAIMSGVISDQSEGI